MDEADRRRNPSPAAPKLTTYQVVLALMLGLLAVVSWSFAVWGAYVNLPATRKLVADFKMRVDPSSRVVLGYADLALPVVACVALFLAWWTRSRLAWGFVLVGLPLLAGAALYFISDHYVSSLLEGLRK